MWSSLIVFRFLWQHVWATNSKDGKIKDGGFYSNVNVRFYNVVFSDRRYTKRFQEILNRDWTFLDNLFTYQFHFISRFILSFIYLFIWLFNNLFPFSFEFFFCNFFSGCQIFYSNFLGNFFRQFFSFAIFVATFWEQFFVTISWEIFSSVFCYFFFFLVSFWGHFFLSFQIFRGGNF